MEYAGAVYHVTARGNRRKRIFVDDADHERFLEYVEEAARRFRWVITSFVLMVNSLSSRDRDSGAEPCARDRETGLLVLRLRYAVGAL
jgi:hypothetical protein